MKFSVVKAWFQFNPHIASHCKSKECIESDKIANLTKLLCSSKTENFLPLLLLLLLLYYYYYYYYQ